MSSIKTKKKSNPRKGSKPSKGTLLGEGEKVLECSCSQHTEDNQSRLEHYKSGGRNVSPLLCIYTINLMKLLEDVLYQNKGGKQDRKKI